MFKAHTVMKRDIVTVKSDTPILEAIRILVKNEITSIPVVDDDQNLVGILSEKDALSLLQGSDERTLCVGGFMTKQVVHFDENGSLVEISKCLSKSSFRRIPITSGGKKVVGMLSRTNIMKKILEMRHVSIDDSLVDGEDA